MTAVSLKKKIISQLRKTSDKNVLADIYRILDFEDSDEDFYILSKEQLKKVKIAEKQLAQGKIHSDEKVNRQIEKWLRK